MKYFSILLSRGAAILGALVALAVPAAADGYVNFHATPASGYSNATTTARKLNKSDPTTTNMWAVTSFQPIVSQDDPGNQLHVLFFYTNSLGQLTSFDTSDIFKGDSGNIGNVDFAAPVPLAMSRVVTDVAPGSDPPIQTQRQELTSNLYVLWLNKETGSSSSLYAAFLQDGTQEIGRDEFGDTRPIVHKLRDNIPQGTASFGAAALPDGKGFVTATVSLDKTKVDVAYYTWDPNATAFSVEKAYEQSVQLPLGLPGAYDGNIACAITRNYDNMARWYPYRLTLALDPCQTGRNVMVREYRLNNKMPASMYPRYFLTSAPQDVIWHAVGGATNNNQHATGLHQAANGRLYVAVGESAGMTLYGRTGYDPNTQAPLWEAAGHGELLQPFTDNVPAFIYRPRFPATPPPADQQVTFPVARAMFVRNDIGAPEADSNEFVGYEKSAAGFARRLPLPAKSAASAVVLGIVDGPPPIPNENFTIAAPNDPRPFTFANSSVAFNWSSTSQVSTSSEYTSALTVGMTATQGLSFAGIGGEAEVSGEMTHSLGTAYSRATGTTIETYARFANATTTDPTGRVIVTPLGALYCVFQRYKGYSYEFLDATSQAIPGAQVYTQVWPDGAPTVQVLDYWMNPNGRQPGNLLSYVADNDTRERLKSLSKIGFQAGAASGDPNSTVPDHLYFGFTDQNTFGSSWGQFTKDESTTTSGIKIGEALKLSASIDIEIMKTGGDVSVASESEVKRTRATAKDNSVGLVSEADVTTDRNVPGTYYHASFETYLLKDDNHYLQELLSEDPDGIGLVTPTWPPLGSRMRQDNETIKSLLIRTSTPWKVTYILADTPLKTQPLGAAAPSAPVPAADEPGGFVPALPLPLRSHALLAPRGGAMFLPRALALASVPPRPSWASGESPARRAPGVNAGEPALDPALVAKLVGFGVRTTGVADLLVRKKEQVAGAGPTLLTNAPVYEVALRRHADREALDKAIARYFPDASVLRRALDSLTWSDVAALKAYSSALAERDRAEFVAENPVRYPAVPPAEVMARPAIVNKGAMFTSPPPPGR